MADEQASIIEWVSRAAQIAGAAAFGWMFRTNTQVSRLEQRMTEAERKHTDRAAPIYETKERVAVMESDITHLGEKIDDLKASQDKTQRGVEELLRRSEK